MAGKTEPPPGYYPHPPPIAQARGTENAVHQVCARVESILPKFLRAQEISIIDAYLDLANIREYSILAL
jgi:predicted kinase